MNRFAKMRWPEIDLASEQDRVVLIPTGTLEDHGLHLPVDTDVVIAEEVCSRVADALPDGVVVMPPVVYGFSPHHIDGPGTVTIRWDTFIESVQQVVSSLAYHGFRRILLVNGHGSNEPVLDVAARLSIVENPDILCAMTSWWGLERVHTEVASFRESEWTGHACELETSLYLAIDPDLVREDLEQVDINPHMSPHFWADLVGQAPEGYAGSVRMNEYWSTVSATGTWGDPTVSSAEKGERILAAACEELVDLVRELAERPIRNREPRQHSRARARNERHSGMVPRFTI
jgi:creatinine amidohydrolase